MKKLFLILFYIFIATTPLIAQNVSLPQVEATSFRADTLSIVNFNAKSDAITLNTNAINLAIDKCSKNGGGVVKIPAGFWLTGPIILKSNVNLYLERNALLQFTSDFNEYKLLKSNWEGVPAVRNESPISATDATNIAITGFGIIDGNGDAWRIVKKDKLTESQWKKKVDGGGIVGDDKKTWFPSASSLIGSKTEKPGVLQNGKTINDFSAIKDYLRPNLLVFANCNKVLLQGVTFQNSPAWCLHPLMCSNVVVQNITVKNPWYAQNGDGIDIESCKNVLVENSSFDVGDDGICIKSGRDEEGRKRAMPTQDVIIRNCTVYHAHGGFVIGSEMSGGAKNIYVSNCNFLGTDIGLRFKTTRGRGGVVENIYVSNINMKDIVGEAILFDMYYMAKDPVPLAGEKNEEPKVVMLLVTEGTPSFKNFYIDNITCLGAAKAIFIRGLPEMKIEDINLSNLVIDTDKGIDISEAKNISLQNVKLILKHTNPAISILNSRSIDFNKVLLPKNAETTLKIGGKTTNDIIWEDSTPLNGNTIYEFGASPNALKIK
ncbi:MAG: glycoside hydrolase family 28 protein [Bacteroidetes bacterium]|nr:glycoside hydrolase family 28 protein [Bacteroidota bacterium]